MVADPTSKGWIFKGLIAYEENFRMVWSAGKAQVKLVYGNGSSRRGWQGSARSKGACGVIYIALEYGLNEETNLG
jgi:hypothetical protein